jgi:hypothetical protein
MLYCGMLYAWIVAHQEQRRRLNLLVLGIDLGCSLTLVRLTGGVESPFFSGSLLDRRPPGLLLWRPARRELETANRELKEDVTRRIALERQVRQAEKLRALGTGASFIMMLPAGDG